VLRGARSGFVLAALLALAGCQLLGPPGAPSEEERSVYREAVAKRESDPKGAARELALFLERWPRSNAGYPPEAYSWALGTLWAVQLAGLAWFWSGRALLEKDVAVGRV